MDIEKLLLAWPKTPEGKACVADAALRIQDPAFFFYLNADDDIVCVVLPRERVQKLVGDLLGPSSKTALLLGESRPTFYWAVYVGIEDSILLAYAAAPAKAVLN